MDFGVSPPVGQAWSVGHAYLPCLVKLGLVLAAFTKLLVFQHRKTRSIRTVASRPIRDKKHPN